LPDKAQVFLRYGPAYFRRAIVPNERDRELLPLPTFLSFLHYLIRPIRLTVELGKRRL
jgi:hypothetical protein